MLVHRLVVRQRGEGVLSSAAFVFGYLIVWSVIGLGPLTAYLSFRNLSGDVTNSRWLMALLVAIKRSNVSFGEIVERHQAEFEGTPVDAL